MIFFKEMQLFSIAMPMFTCSHFFHVALKAGLDNLVHIHNYRPPFSSFLIIGKCFQQSFSALSFYILLAEYKIWSLQKGSPDLKLQAMFEEITRNFNKSLQNGMFLSSSQPTMLSGRILHSIIPLLNTVFYFPCNTHT